MKTAIEKSFWFEVIQYDEEKKMPYVTSVERIGIEKGKKEGRREGRVEGLLSGIEVSLELKFGNEELAILPDIQQIDDVDKLRAVLNSIKTVHTLKELRRVYQ